MRKKENKSKKRKISFFKILALLLLLMSVFMEVIFSKIDILPTKYFFILIGILIFINIFCDAFLFRKKAKKLRVFFSVITIIIMFLMGFISYYVLDTLGFLSSIKDTNYKVENYSVVVLSSSEYEKIEDVIYNLEKRDKIDILNMSEIIYKSKDEKLEILDYMNVVFIDLAKKSSKYAKCINIVEETKRRLQSNANYDMCIDNMLFNLWEEVN